MSVRVSLKDALQQALPESYKAKIRCIQSVKHSCEPLFSPLPGQPKEKTQQVSHFLTVSINYDAGNSQHNSVTTNDVFSLAIEVLVYTTRRLTTLFVSKVDSTPFTSRERPSPTKTVISTYLRWLIDQQCHTHPKTKLVVSLFARAQAQYLFPGSSADLRKHVLDDRQLIKWWARVLDPIIQPADTTVRYKGYITVPGYAGNELRSFMPSTALLTDGSPRWQAGHPLIDLANTRGVSEHAPPRCLLPRFPDDPKARYMQDLDDEVGIVETSNVTESPSKHKSGRWNSIRSLDRFWEAMEFRQECSSGRAVGFLWLVIAPEHEDAFEAQDDFTPSNSQETGADVRFSSQDKRLANKSGTTAARRKKTRLVGPIIPRQPRLKGASSSSSGLDVMVQAQKHASSEHILVLTEAGYDQAVQILLNLDFSSLDSAVRSTKKWRTEVANIASLKIQDDFAIDIVGTVPTPPSILQGSAYGTTVINDLGGMIKKKRKPLQDPSSDAPEQPARDAATISQANGTGVNVLNAGLVRKKSKPAVH